MPQARMDALYRQHAPAMIAVVTRMLGPARLDEVEALVHDAFVRALGRWPVDGEPENPGGWLMTVARNAALDVLRRGARFSGREVPEDSVTLVSPVDTPGPLLRGELPDDQLRMMFVVCDSALGMESQVALALRTLCGFSVEDIAGALLTQPAAIEKRLVRARSELRAEGLDFDAPVDGRLEGVLRVLYLLFSEGYSAQQGSQHIRAELCEESIRLCRVLLAHPSTETPRTHALMALMLLQSGRLRARQDEHGNLVPLERQDRARWDRARMGEGMRHLALSARDDVVTELHLEAGIAACHAMAETFADTDWERVAGFYDRLLALNPSPVVRMNRAIALAFGGREREAQRELRALEQDPRLKAYGHLQAAAGELAARAGQPDVARRAYERALALTATDAERRFLLQRLAELA